MTTVAREIKRLIEEGEQPTEIANALGLGEEAVSTLVQSMVDRGEVKITPRAFAEGKMDELLSELFVLAKCAESESVRLDALKYLIAEGTGREEAKAKAPQLSGVNIMVIEDAFDRKRKAQEAVQRALMQKEAIAV